MTKNQSYFLFEHYRKNLNAITKDKRITLHPDRDDIVLCPLCFDKYFTSDDLDAGHLTIEHAPPEKVSGEAHTLTCKDCNNHHGSSLDSHLVDYLQSWDALVGEGKTYIDSYVNAEDEGEFRAEIRFSDNDGIELLAVPKASNPKNITAFTKSLHSGDGKFNFRMDFGNELRARLSLIRAAYLIAFQYLGYGFLLNLNLKRLRSQFKHPEKDIFPMKSVCFNSFPDVALGINIGRNSKNKRFYFVVFDVQIKDSVSRRLSVMLPGPNPKDYEVFEALEEAENENITVKHYSLEFQDKLEMPFLAYHLWNRAFDPESD